MTDQGIALVTGANGFIGSHLVDHLVGRGRQVRALVRPRADRRWLHPAAEVVEGDVTDPLSLLPAVRGVRTVFHVAGVVASFRTRAYREVNEGGTRSLVLACRKACPDLGRFVLVSSLAAAGPSRDGRPVRETDPPRPVSLYGLSKLAGERVAVAAADGIPVTVVRPPVVYGPRDRNMLTIFLGAARGTMPSFPREKYYSVLHVRDLVRGLADCAGAEVAAARTYHLADPRARSLSASLGLIARAVGGRPGRFPLVLGLLPLLAGILDAVSPVLRLPVPPLRDKVRELVPDYWIADTRRAREELGFRTREDYAEGLAEVARFYVGQGWIPGRSAAVC